MSSTGAKDRDPLTAAFDYGEARRVQLTYRRQQASFRCEWKDAETAPCWQTSDTDVDWCESCRLRQPIYRDWRAWLQRERKALKRLQELLVRAQEGR